MKNFQQLAEDFKKASDDSFGDNSCSPLMSNLEAMINLPSAHLLKERRLHELFFIAVQKSLSKKKLTWLRSLGASPFALNAQFQTPLATCHSNVKPLLIKWQQKDWQNPQNPFYRVIDNLFWGYRMVFNGIVATSIIKKNNFKSLGNVSTGIPALKKSMHTFLQGPKEQMKFLNPFFKNLMNDLLELFQLFNEIKNMPISDSLNQSGSQKSKDEIIKSYSVKLADISKKFESTMRDLFKNVGLKLISSSFHLNREDILQASRLNKFDCFYISQTEFNGFRYALYTLSDAGFYSQIFSNLNFERLVENPNEFFSEVGYSPVTNTQSALKIGDVILYCQSSKLSQIAVVVGKNNRVVSKWGAFMVVKGPIDTIPTQYGCVKTILRNPNRLKTLTAQFEQLTFNETSDQLVNLCLPRSQLVIAFNKSKAHEILPKKAKESYRKKNRV